MNSWPWFSRTRIFALSLRSSLVLLTGVLGCLCPAGLSAQAVTLNGATSFVDFGTANLCKVGQTTPAPCSKTLTLDYKVTASGTLGTPKVLTKGSPNLDFTLAAGTTCIGLVTAGGTCTVNVTFAPLLPGTRPGGVLITDAEGKVIATTYIAGGAVGPQIGFNPGIQKEIHSFTQDAVWPTNIIVDGAGDLFIGNYSLPEMELPVGGGPPIRIHTGPTTRPDVTTMDGPGNLFVWDGEQYIFVKVPAGGGTPTVLPYQPGIIGGLPMTGMATNVNGDLYFALSDDYDDLLAYLLVFPVGGGTAQQLTLPDTVEFINSLAIGGGGEIYLVYGYQPIELPHGGSDWITLPFTSLEVNYSGAYSVLADGNGDVLIQNQELAPGARTTTLQPSAIDLNNYPSVTLDAAGNYFFMGVERDLSIWELQRSQLPSLDFGSVTVGSTKTLPLQFTNTGNETLVASPDFDSPSYNILSATPENCTAGIAVGHTCTLEIQFSPLTAGPHNIDLTMKTNGAADTVTLLKGTGTT